MILIAADVQLDEDLVKPGWIALLLVLALAVATFLLWRSMNTQIRRIQVPKDARPDRRSAYDGATAAAAQVDEVDEVDPADEVDGTDPVDEPDESTSTDQGR